MFEFFFRIQGGTTEILPATITRNDQIYNLSGVEVSFTALSSLGTITKDRDGGIAVTNETGEIEIEILPADTDNFVKTEDMLCEIKLIDGEDIFIAGRGMLRVIPLSTAIEEAGS